MSPAPRAARQAHWWPEESAFASGKNASASMGGIHRLSFVTHHALAGGISSAAMQAIDRAAIDRVGIPRLILMEHAGWAVARLTRRWIGAPPQRIIVCCGLGYNGADGLHAARHLAQWGYRVRVLVLGRRAELRDEAALSAHILRRLAIPLEERPRNFPALQGPAAAIIDALLGLGLRGQVRPLYAQAIRAINRARVPVVAVDIPSGLDADTGLLRGDAVRADVTVTFGRPKRGLLIGEGPRHAGRLVVDPITFPPQLLS